MNARIGVAMTLLLAFPASTLAQVPANRLDLTSLRLNAPPVSAPIRLAMPAPHPHEFQAAAQPSCADSEAKGRTDADQKPMHKGWFWGGFAAGAITGIYGVAGAPIVAATIKPKPKDIPAGVDQSCYAQGFGSKGRHEHTLTAFLGSLAGFGVWIVIYAIAGSIDD